MGMWPGVRSAPGAGRGERPCSGASGVAQSCPHLHLGLWLPGRGENEFLSLPSFAPAAPGPSRRLNIRQLLGRLVRARVVLLLLIAPGYHFRK